MQLNYAGVRRRLCRGNYHILNRAKTGYIPENSMLIRRMIKMGWDHRDPFPDYIKMDLTSGEVWYSEDGDAWFPLCWTEE